jgi:hypothetical protein
MVREYCEGICRNWGSERRGMNTARIPEALGRNTAEGLTHRIDSITVAVGTTIADRPPHRSVRARLRIRLLRRMSGVEACIRIGVQNPGWWNPPVQDWGKSFPPHLSALATADQNTLP